MEVGLTLSLENQQGNLDLSLLQCGCYVKDISIELNGGASWLYQGFHLFNISNILVSSSFALVMIII